MRYLLVNIGYHPFVGGSQSYCQWLAESLVKDGHKVTVFTTTASEVEGIWNNAKPQLPPGRATVNGVEVVRFPIKYITPSPYAFYLIKRATVALSLVPFVSETLLLSLARYTPWVPGLAEAFRSYKDQVDLLHLFTIPFESLMTDAIAWAERAGAPAVVTPFAHAGEAGDAKVMRGYTMPHQVYLLNRCRAVMVLTDIEGELLRDVGVGPGKVVKVGAGIPLPEAGYVRHGAAQSGEGNQSRQVLFLGAATYEKGAIHLVDAVRLLDQRGVDAHAVIAGTEADHFKRYLQKMPPQDSRLYTVLGRVTEDKKRELLSSCDLLAMPSRVDSFGLVYLEAWSHGKPVIGARAGGVPEVICHGEDGYLVDFGDVPELAGAIQRLLDCPSERERLGSNGRAKLMERYRWEAVYGRILQVYERALKG